ncbi:MAG: hypothetical protein DRO40_05090 [Thermoprotei archaeon]|nr:MAG: hypothetical protein DRO40_05090 [Thermoprotei archaeon]
MSASTYQPRGGPFSWVLRLFGFKRDVRSPAIMKTVQLLNKMIGDLEVTRKKMEDRYDDLERKAREAALKGDRDNHNIFINEMSEISKFIALVIQAKKSLMQIKLRLETMLDMGNTLDMFPDIISELSTLKPLLARITPDLLDKMTELEKSVINIMSSTSLPNLYGKVEPKKESAVQKIDLNELLPPNTVPAKPATARQALRASRVSLTVIKKWLLEEIRLTNGFIQLESFARKYGVPKEAILEALHELSDEGKIVIKT